MEWLAGLWGVVLHLDQHLVQLLAEYGLWLYLILFAIIFAETGFVVTPFLPGDSLLFGAGALAAVDSSGNLRLAWLLPILCVAAVSGNTLNYRIGRTVGARAFDGRLRFVRQEHLQRTERFFERYGGMAIVLSRFTPIVRTLAPFVAGVGRMDFWRFEGFNVLGGVAWVSSLTIAGYAFGNLAWVKQNFGMVTLAIVALSMLPLLVGVWRERSARG